MKDDFSCLIFDHETGTVTRTYANGSVRHDVGHVNSNGYKILRVNKKMYQLHRLIWQDRYGPIPEKMEIDHIDGNKLNNKIENLRLTTHGQNMQNQSRAHRTNKVGLKGVGRQHGKYRARITAQKKVYWLGVFDTPEEAHNAYKLAAKKFHTHNPMAMQA